MSNGMQTESQKDATVIVSSFIQVSLNAHGVQLCALCMHWNLNYNLHGQGNFSRIYVVFFQTRPVKRSTEVAFKLSVYKLKAS